MLPKLGSRSSFPLFPSIFGPPPPHVLDPLEVGKASGCGGGRFQTEETSVPEGGDISVADINDDDIDFDEEISFLPDSQSQRGRLVQAVDEAISRSRSAVAACASNRRSFEDGRFDFISKGFEELVGYSRAELQSKELMRLLSPDIRCAFQCESQLNMATDAGATAAAMLRRKTGELVAARVLRQVFTIPLADLGLQDLQVSVVMYMEEKSEATSPLHRLDGLDGPDDSPPVPELTLLERMRDLQSEVVSGVMSKVMADTVAE
ncbi:Setd6 [Symbiodinium microadriaticum]|nr:Setd6 [Symbiodinium microadriaticum]